MTQPAYEKYSTKVELTKASVAEFKAIYVKEFGVELSDAEAYEKASALLRLIGTILKAEDALK